MGITKAQMSKAQQQRHLIPGTSTNPAAVNNTLSRCDRGISPQTTADANPVTPGYQPMLMWLDVNAAATPSPKYISKKNYEGDSKQFKRRYFVIDFFFCHRSLVGY